MRLPTRNCLLILSPRQGHQSTCHHLSRSLVTVSQSVFLTERPKFGMSTALRPPLSQMQHRSCVSQKTNGSGSPNKGVSHHQEHKHGLFGGHEHGHDHGTDAEKIIQALKGGGELSASLPPQMR